MMHDRYDYDHACRRALAAGRVVRLPMGRRYRAGQIVGRVMMIVALALALTLAVVLAELAGAL